MSYKTKYNELVTDLDRAYTAGQKQAQHGSPRQSFYALCEHGRWLDAAFLAGYDDAIDAMREQAAIMHRLAPSSPLPPPPRCTSTAPRIQPPTNITGAQCVLGAGHADWHSDGDQPTPMRWNP